MEASSAGSAGPSRDDDETFPVLRERALSNGTGSASGSGGSSLRYLATALRGVPPEQVFAQAMFDFELAAVDARSDLTNESQRAVDEQGLSYRELKQMSRNAIAYSFLPAPEKARFGQQLDAAFVRFEAQQP